MGVFVNVNASEDQEMITSNQVLEDGFLEETEEEEFLNFSTKVNGDWTVKPQILKRSKGFTKKAGSIIYINLKIFPHKKVQPRSPEYTVRDSLPEAGLRSSERENLH